MVKNADATLARLTAVLVRIRGCADTYASPVVVPAQAGTHASAARFIGCVDARGCVDAGLRWHDDNGTETTNFSLKVQRLYPSRGLTPRCAAAARTSSPGLTPAISERPTDGRVEPSHDDFRESNSVRSIPLLERVAAEAAVYGNDGAGDVLGERRRQKDGEDGELLRFAVAAHRDFRCGMALAVFLGIVAADLLAHDAAGRDRVDRDAVLADLARQTFRPCVNGRLGREGGVEALRLGLAGDIDDAPPAARDHLRQQRMRDLPLAREVEGDRLGPLLLRRIDRQRAAAAGAVDEDIDMTERGEGGVAQALRRVLRHDVLRDQGRPQRLRPLDLVRQLFEQPAAAGDGGDVHAFGGQALRDRSPDAHAGARHQCRLSG